MNESYVAFKRKFEDHLNNFIVNKTGNPRVLDRKAYDALIHDIKTAKLKAGKRAFGYRQWKKFDILKVDGVERIIQIDRKCKGYKYCVPADEIFDIMYNAHMKTNHGSKYIMSKELCLFKNITVNMITVWLKYCDFCASLTNDGRTCLIGLIPMTEVDGYTHILVHKERSTRFTQLRPLKKITCDEIANVLLDIYTIFGPPCYLSSDFDREFTKNIILILNRLWPEVKIDIFSGRMTRNRTILNMAVAEIKSLLDFWLMENSSATWVKGLKFVQLIANKNQGGLKKSPFEIMLNGLPSVDKTANYNNKYVEENSKSNILIKEEINIEDDN